MPQQIMPLFPTLVSQALYDKAAEFNPRARRRLGELEQQGGLRTPGQWQSHHELHKDPVFQELVEFILSIVGERFAALSYHPANLAMTGFWANINAPGYQHRVHAHSNNFLSGVYYVSAPENAGGLVFHDPRKQHQVLLPAVKEWNNMNATSVRLPAVEGQLFVFPSWLEHYTEQNASAEMRISIAFNLMLTGGFGSPETFAGGYTAL